MGCSLRVGTARAWLLALSMAAIGLFWGSGQETALAAPPEIDGERGIVVDTLTDEVLFEKFPDSQALQGSIAKIMTAHVALEAVQAGTVQLGDEIAISERAQIQGCTCLQDVLPPSTGVGDPDGDGVSDVQVGEIFVFGDLLYAVIIKSAGEATDAVAEYVAAKTYGLEWPAPSYEESEKYMNLFLGLMNDHVDELGLQNTRFVTVHGGDLCDFSIGCEPECDEYDCEPECFSFFCQPSGTTPRDLVTIWRHIAEDPMFLTIAGARSHDLASALGDELKLYNVSQGFGYHPGIDGDKEGNSILCQECLVSQATRVGRTHIGVVMQSIQRLVDIDAMFDYGFSETFRPQLMGSSDPWGPVKDNAVACLASDRAVTAFITPDQKVQLINWFVDAGNGQLDELGRGEGRPWPGRLPPSVTRGDGGGGGFQSEFVPTEIDVTHMGGGVLVVGVKRGLGVELLTFGVPGDGAPFPLNTGVVAGEGSNVVVEALTDDIVVSAFRSPQDTLIVKTWRVSEGGHDITLLDTGDTAPDIEEFDMTARQWFLSGQVLTAGRHPNGNLQVHSWLVDVQDGAGEGNIDFVDSFSGGSATKVRVAPVNASDGLDATYATALRLSTGNLKVHLWSLSTTGEIDLIGDSGDTGPAVPASGEIQLAPMRRDGVLTASLSGLTSDFVVWDTNEDNLLDNFNGALRMAEALQITGKLRGLCKLPGTAAEGDFLLAHEGYLIGHLMALSAWRSAERP